MLPLNIDLRVLRFLIALTEEGLSGRLQHKNSINWVNPDGWELRVVDVEPLVPTHGNFAGPGYSCGERRDCTLEEMRNYPVAMVIDPVTGVERFDYIDLAAKQHDIDYKEAKEQPNCAELIMAADQRLVDATRVALKRDNLTRGERNYGQSLLDAFELKLKTWDKIAVFREYLNNGGYDYIIANNIITDIYYAKGFFYPEGQNEEKVFAPWTDLWNASKSARYLDPLILDLDNDGLETSSITDGAYFDHDNNGFAEQTGWVSSDDGLLVMDRNSNGTIDNGTELFGDQTILINGQKATDGFQALSELDTNTDGIIDLNDASFSNLRIWQDIYGDGYNTPDELFTLEETGIQSITLSHTDTSIPDSRGNTQTQAGTFIKTDGTTASIGGFNLQRDVTYTIADEWLDIPDDIAVLPDLQGYGSVYDLHQATARDTTGTLKSLMEQFITTEDITTRESIMEQILFRWTGSDTINPDSRGPNFDARKLAVLEKLMGQSFTGVNGSNPNALAAPILAQAYEGIFEMYYAQLMAQTHLKYVYDAITYIWDEATESLKGDLNTANLALQNSASSVSDAQEFIRTVHGFRAEMMLDIYPVISTFQIPDEGSDWSIYSQGRTIREGTEGNDNLCSDPGINTAIRGGRGNDVLYGDTGSDVLYGNEGNDQMNGGCENDILNGCEGDDFLYGGNANDTLIGGSGDDTLYGEQGDDTYIYNKGFVNDTINEEEGIDTVQFNVNQNDLEFSISGIPGDNGIIIRIKETGESLRIKKWFSGDQYKVENFIFADNMLTSAQAESIVIANGITGSNYNDTLFATFPTTISGKDGNDWLCGSSGNDTLYGNAGYDTLNGGGGNDILDDGAGDGNLYGGTGDDTYIFTQGSDNDYIIEEEGTDTLRLSGLNQADISFSISGFNGDNGLLLRNINTGEYVRIAKWFTGINFRIENFVFEDGSITGDQAEALAIATGIIGTDNADTIYGPASAGTIISGLGGNDIIYGGGLDDTIHGGTGNDSLSGGGGNDTVYGDEGSDSLNGGEGNDTLYGNAGYDTLNGGGGNDILDDGAGDGNLYGGTGDDTYIFTQGSDNDYIIEEEGTDTLRLSGLNQADISFSISGFNGDNGLLLRNINTGEYVRIAKWFTGINFRIENFVFEDGSITGDQAEALAIATGIIGTDNADTIYGPASAGTIISGLGGNDIIYGGGLDDTIHGGTGNDSLSGGGGNDTVYGDEGSDSLNGGEGNDTLYGNAGYDTLNGGGGNDILDDGAGDGNLYGGTGDDTYIFTQGSDNDYIIEEEGTDTLRLSGLNQADISFSISGFNGDNGLLLRNINTGEYVRIAKWFTGINFRIENFVFEDGSITGDQAEALAFTGSILGTDNADTIYGPANAAVTILGQGGDDKIYAGDLDDTIRGGTGNDSLSGGSGNDTIYGEEGNDSLNGGGGNDMLYGGEGSDTVTGSTGNDTLYGNAGYDTLNGGDGNDILDDGAGDGNLYGGKGDDTYIYSQGSDNDYIIEEGGTDTLRFNNLNQADISFSISGFNGDNGLLLRNINTGEYVRIAKWFEGSNYRIENFVFEDGSITGDQAEALAFNGSILGTDNADTIYGPANAAVTILGQGGDDKIYAGDLDDTIRGGTGNDSLSGGSGNDTIYGEEGNDSLNGGGGNDMLYGGEGSDTVTGSTGNDTLYGNAGYNTLNGGDGNDILDDGAGDGNLYGGKGDDTYIYSQGSDNDYIIEEGGTDTLRFNNLNQSDISFSISGFNGDNGLLLRSINTGEYVRIAKWFEGSNYRIENFVFEDGSITGDQAEALAIATGIIGTDNADTIYGPASAGTIISGLGGNDIIYGGGLDDTIHGGTGNDSLSGGGGNDTVYGEEGGDYLYGNDGNDILYGNAGNDTMNGGRGDDSYYVDCTGDMISENTNEGIDTVITNIAYTIGTNLENLVLIGTDSVNGTGNILNNIITGNNADNVLTGNTGDDTLDGASGNDTLIGNEGSDTYIFASVYGQDLINDAGLITDTDKIIFSAGISVNDVVVTRPGDDLSINIKNTLDGITIYNWYQGNRIEQFAFPDGTILSADDIECMVLPTITGTDNDDKLYGTISAERLIGLSGNDYISAGAGDDTLAGGEGNDTLNGGAGMDTMIGGPGNDKYYIDTLADIVIENENEGTDRVYSPLSYTLGPASNIENLTLTGTEAINGTGNEFNNSITGNSGNNTLAGGEGNDTLNGGAGMDTMIGGPGNDKYYIDTLADIVIENENEGTDRVYSPLSYTLGPASNIENLTLTGTEAINGTGNEFNNSITGNSGNNTLAGGAGNDYISAGAGDDTLAGGEGNDTLNGGAGMDTMIGGPGNDKYYIDNFADIVVENENEGTDRVYSPLSYTLGPASNIENLTLTGTEAINGTGNEFNNSITGNSGNNTLTGGAGNDYISAGAGDDTLIGGEGNDTLNGGSGNNIYRFSSGNGRDTIAAAGADNASIDEIDFTDDVFKETIAIFQKGSNLIIGYGDTDRITISNQTSTDYGIEKMELSDGRFLTDADINLLIEQLTAFANDNGIMLTSLDDVKKNNDLMNMVVNAWHS